MLDSDIGMYFINTNYSILLSTVINVPPANVLLVTVSLFIPSSDLPVPPINLTAVTYTLYIVYGLRLSRVYVPVKPVSLVTCLEWLWLLLL